MLGSERTVGIVGDWIAPPSPTQGVQHSHISCGQGTAPEIILGELKPGFHMNRRRATLDDGLPRTIAGNVGRSPIGWPCPPNDLGRGGCDGMGNGGLLN